MKQEALNKGDGIQDEKAIGVRSSVRIKENENNKSDKLQIRTSQQFKEASEQGLLLGEGLLFR